MVGSYARVSIFIIAKINVKAESTRANNSTHGLYPVERSCFDTDGDLLNQLAVRSGRNISKSGKGETMLNPAFVSHVREVSNWTAGQHLVDCFPFLQGAVNIGA